MHVDNNSVDATLCLLLLWAKRMQKFEVKFALYFSS